MADHPEVSLCISRGGYSRCAFLHCRTSTRSVGME